MNQVSLILSQPSTVYADAINVALWRLTRPESVNDTYCTTSVHPVRGQVALNFVEGDTQPVHPEADVGAFMDVLSPALNPDATISIQGYDENGEPNGSVQSPEPDVIRDIIETARGGRINILEILQISPTLSPNLRTREQMEADGWYPTEEETL